MDILKFLIIFIHLLRVQGVEDCERLDCTSCLKKNCKYVDMFGQNLPECVPSSALRSLPILFSYAVCEETQENEIPSPDDAGEKGQEFPESTDSPSTTTAEEKEKVEENDEIIPQPFNFTEVTDPPSSTPTTDEQGIEVNVKENDKSTPKPYYFTEVTDPPSTTTTGEEQGMEIHPKFKIEDKPTRKPFYFTEVTDPPSTTGEEQGIEIHPKLKIEDKPTAKPIGFPEATDPPSTTGENEGTEFHPKFKIKGSASDEGSGLGEKSEKNPIHPKLTTNRDETVLNNTTKDTGLFETTKGGNGTPSLDVKYTIVKPSGFIPRIMQGSTAAFDQFSCPDPPKSETWMERMDRSFCRTTILYHRFGRKLNAQQKNKYKKSVKFFPFKARELYCAFLIWKQKNCMKVVE